MKVPIRRFTGKHKKAASLAHTLGLVHQKNIIHRDLTSDPIAANPETKEIHNMDIAQAIQLDVKIPHLNPPDQLKGSMAYYSPEDIMTDRYFRYAAKLIMKGVSPGWTWVEIMTE